MSQTHDHERSVFFRPAILLAAAYLIITCIHESAHALTAYALNVPFTMFHFAVDLARDRGTLTDYGVIALAGPLSSLIIGLGCWFFYRRSKGRRSELMLLYLVTFGAGTFFGNLISASFVGADFSRVSLALHLPMAARYVLSVIGLLTICGLHFWAGWEFRRLAPAGSSRLSAMILMVLLPVVCGTAIVVLCSVPIRSAFVFGRLAEISFWSFAVAGALISRNTPSGSDQTFHLRWFDWTILAVAVIATRVLAVGIAFQP